MIDYAKVLMAKYKGAVWTLDGTDYSGLTWLSETDKPTKTVLDNLAAQMQADEQAAEEARETQRQVILDRLGLTAEEAKLLLA